jgi:probable HAF family extracellular repeat protein
MSQGKRLLTVSIVALLALLLPSRASAEVPLFQPLGDLAGGPCESMALGVSADGNTIVGQGAPRWPDGDDFGWEALRWTDGGGMTGLGSLAGWPATTATGVSGDGSVVSVTARYGNYGERSRACRWTAATGLQNLGTLGGAPGNQWSYTAGASADGTTIVGGSTSSTGTQAFRWTETGSMEGLGYLSDTSTSYATGVSADGQVIVGNGYSTFPEAFRWTPTEGMVGLGRPLGADGTSAWAVSLDGMVIVGDISSSASHDHGFRWTQDGGFVDLGSPPGPGGSVNPRCVSGDGSVIGGWYGRPVEGDPDSEWVTAFVWDNDHGVRDLKSLLLSFGLDAVADWSLAEVRGVSADGLTLVGYGTHTDGSGGWASEAFLVRLPEPGTGLLLCVALVAARRRGVAFAL